VAESVATLFPDQPINYKFLTTYQIHRGLIKVPQDAQKTLVSRISNFYKKKSLFLFFTQPDCREPSLMFVKTNSFRT